MHLKTLKLWKFRGFASSNYNHEVIDGPHPVIVDMAVDTTVFIGRNGAGKSAMLQALLRLFGETRDERKIQPADFFVEPGERLESVAKRELFLEVEIAFPELDGGDADAERTVPSAFRHMIVTSPGAAPFARLRLEATWELGGTLDGVIEEKLFWILTPDDVPTGEGSALVKRKVSASERSHIVVRYIPASRDVTALTQLTVKSLGRSLMNAVVWQNKDEIAELVAKAAEKLDAEGALARVNAAINACWSELNTAETGTTAKLAVLAPDLQQIVRSATIQLSPSSQGRTMTVEDLSDGQRSLFHFALVKALLDLKLELEAEVRDAKTPPFEAAFARAPALTVFAFEEPENHLAPFFLARLLMQLSVLTKTARVQGVLTSHAPSIVGRIEPKAIRHIRRETKTGLSTVCALALPEDGTEAAKFVREAVRAHPEIYFARHAIFGEGASEEIVLPWLAEKIGVPMDRSFVAIVPVGGRHIQHFWRLVEQLGIPHSTLLDLDLGRSSGDYVQFSSVAKALTSGGHPRSAEQQKWLDAAIELKRPPAWGEGSATDKFLQDWMAWLEQFGVFFSAPLDLDMLMVEAFPDAYKTLPDRATGPRGADDADVIAKAAKEVVGADGFGVAPYEADKNWPLFSWYKYLFLGSRGKPAAHLFALATLEADEDADIQPEIPKVLARLVAHVKASLEAPIA
ncbi:ATP-dependent nuclease [Sphingomonas sp. Leaf20]|uniref:ATP-dependent nuclease n=2 Tax=Sphingomonadaceae TaxID=41297 RepID=UPI000A9F130D|nr:TOPRIM nucleotidyl transferase/hydrolase domain-containing protein [Sphingomonas sp. Leaf20]MBD8546696.1 AAA family ATPase [Sphingomonas sp. CFBP 8760]RYF23089.1 MAG: ATP-dependent endonuclease [Oxalobacteraceae bacterium]